MTRRDTIVLAVLVNLGLLVVLFATAHHPEMAPMTDVAAAPEPIPQVQEMIRPPKAPLKTAPIQETKPSVKTTVAKAPSSKVIPVAKPSKASTTKKVDSSFVEITVKTGDYLERIARLNGTSVAEIMQVNNLQSTQLYVGQVLQVPLMAVAPSKRNIAQETEGPTFYTVQSGDNPWLIALKHRIPLDELLRLNELDEDKARHLRPGDRLRVN